MLGVDVKILSQRNLGSSSKRQIWKVLLQNCKKSTVKHSIEKYMLLIFVNISKILYARLFEETYYHL